MPTCAPLVLFPTFTFAVFFFVVFTGHVLLRGIPVAWKTAMIVASFVFYGWLDWGFTALLALSIIGNAGAAHLVHRATRFRTPIVAASVAANLGVLGYFKYYGFLLESLNDLLPSANLPFVETVLPLGISFFTFQALSYVIDVHRRKIEPASIIDVAVYLSFFPQLVAGPIVRATELLPQLKREIPDRVPASEAVWLIGRGLFKKVVIASYLAESVVDPVFNAPEAASSGEAFLAMYAFAIQIYADFSGYTDIAIGLALLLGFRFPQNFDNPYRSLSVQDFWRRWHMTLSRWLRDYLYIPLGGNRGSQLATYRNLFATMLLGGLWHGASWTFVVWGAVHGLALAVERLWTAVRTPADGPQRAPRPALAPLRWLATFHVVCIAWVLFHADTFGLASTFLSRLVANEWTTGRTPLIENPVVPVLVVIGALAVQFLPRNIPQLFHQLNGRIAPSIQGLVLGVWIAFIVAISPEVLPFIYFQF